MTILHVRGVPENLHRKLKKRAKASKRSLSAEVIVLLNEVLEQERMMEERKQAIERVRTIQATTRPPRKGEPTSVEMLREDRAR